MLNSAETKIQTQTFALPPPGGKKTTVHIVRYPRSLRAKLVLFPHETYLFEWCRNNNVSEAINGGYFLRQPSKPLGEHWLTNQVADHEPYSDDWRGRRGGIHIAPNEPLTIQLRGALPEQILGDFCEVGPTLVRDGLSTFIDSDDPEGFKITMAQHDAYINGERHPRAAIGYSNDHVWTVSADGRTPADAGLYLDELAELFISIGATHAVNLDGGSSTTHISGGKLLNKPRGTVFNPTRTDYSYEKTGRPIFSAITFVRD